MLTNPVKLIGSQYCHPANSSCGRLRGGAHFPLAREGDIPTLGFVMDEAGPLNAGRGGFLYPPLPGARNGFRCWRGSFCAPLFCTLGTQFIPGHGPAGKLAGTPLTGLCADVALRYCSKGATKIAKTALQNCNGLALSHLF